MKQQSHHDERENLLERSADLAFLEDREATPSREQFVSKMRLLWDRRGFLFRIALWGVLASAVLAFALPTRFQSTARLMPPDDKSSGLAMLAALSSQAGGLGALAGDLFGMKNTGALFVGILRSRTVQDRLIERFDLKTLYGSAKMEDTREILGDRTSVSEDRKSGIIAVTVTDKEPERARAMAQAYVDELNRVVAEVSTSSARRERVFIEERLKVVKQELDQAAQAFSQFASKNTTIDIKEQGRAMVEAAAVVQGQLIATQTELEGIREIYTDNNVRVRAVQARIAEIRQQLKALGGVEPDGAALAGQESLYPSIRQLPLLGVTYADLYRRTKVAEVVFELLTQQYELARVQEAKETPTVKLLDAPVVPEKKSFPPRTVLVLLGTLLATVVGMVWILGSAHWADMDPQDPGKTLAKDVFASLKAQVSAASGNGAGLRGIPRRVLSRLRRHDESTTVHK